VATAFHHANLRVRSAEASIRFYESLGLRLQGCMEMPGLFTVYLGAGNEALLELSVRSDGADWDYTVGSGHIALVVDDLAATHERLAAAGTEFEGPPALAGGRSEALVCFTHDPDGHRVELVQGPFAPPQDRVPALGSLAADGTS
jgi:lactoylglutathione lyase